MEIAQGEPTRWLQSYPTAARQVQGEVRIKQRPSRPPIVATGFTTDNDMRFVNVQISGASILCDEVPRCLQRDRRGSTVNTTTFPGEFLAGRSREASSTQTIYSTVQYLLPATCCLLPGTNLATVR